MVHLLKELWIDRKIIDFIVCNNIKGRQYKDTTSEKAKKLK